MKLLGLEARSPKRYFEGKTTFFRFFHLTHCSDEGCINSAPGFINRKEMVFLPNTLSMWGLSFCCASFLRVAEMAVLEELM